MVTPCKKVVVWLRETNLNLQWIADTWGHEPDTYALSPPAGGPWLWELHMTVKSRVPMLQLMIMSASQVCIKTLASYVVKLKL